MNLSEPMNLLLLSEGDAETRDSWSGCTNGLLTAIRRGGQHVVTSGDAELYGADRLLTAVRTLARPRERWRARYRLGSGGFSARSASARALMSRHKPEIDAVLQVGATFDPAVPDGMPYGLYCDSNLCMATSAEGRDTSEAAWLSPKEYARALARERRVYDRADVIFTMSEKLRQSFMDEFDLSADRIVTVHAGPNFDPAAVPTELQKEVDRPPTVLFVGKQFERKGGPFLLRVFRKLRKRLPEARLVIVGPEPRDEEPGVVWRGFIDKDQPGGWPAIAEEYRGADVFCMPTRYEPFGVVFVEAMHFGLPCLGPAAWAVPEIILDGETGFLAPPGDEGIWVDRLLSILTAPALARRMGEAGRKRAATRFTWDHVARTVVDRLAVATAGARPPST